MPFKHRRPKGYFLCLSREDMWHSSAFTGNVIELTSTDLLRSHFLQSCP